MQTEVTHCSFWITGHQVARLGYSQNPNKELVWMAGCRSQCSKILKVICGKGFCNLGKMDPVFKYLDKKENSGLAKASGNCFPKMFLPGSGASSLFPCSFCHTPPSTPQVCECLLVQILCLAQTFMSSQQQFRSCYHKESEDTTTNNTKPHLL